MTEFTLDASMMSKNVDSNYTTTELLSTKIKHLQFFTTADIRKISFEKLQSLICDMEYILGLNNEHNEDYVHQLMKDHLEISGIIPQPGCQVYAQFYSQWANITGRVYALAAELGTDIFKEIQTDITGKEMQLDQRLSRDRAMLLHLDQYTMAHTMFTHVSKNTSIGAGDSADLLSRDIHDPEVMEKCNEFQQSLTAILDFIWQTGYCRYHKNICKQIKTEDGYDTRAWGVISTIKQYLYKAVPKDRYLDLWLKMYRNNKVIPNLADTLANINDNQFTDIVKCRYLWSFKNGLFYGKEEIKNNNKDQPPQYKCMFYPYESKDALKLDSTLTSAKYFDQEFVDYSSTKDWYDIPTPHMQSILNFQRFSKAHARWIYILAGRLCYDIDDLENWQVVPFIKGIANSGKSTLLNKVFEKFYDEDDVRVMANNTEGTFGLAPFLNRFLIIAPEIKKDFKLEQAQFQSMVCADKMSVAIKNQDAVSVKWNIPMILAGNEMPGWKDKGGSIMRRVVPLEFTRQVKDVDTRLDRRLESELPAILQKCVRAYTETVISAGTKSFWKIVPQELLKAQKRVAAATNVLCEFLESNVIVVDDTNTPKEEKNVILFKEFKEEMTRFCLEWTIQVPSRFTPTNSDFYDSQFQANDIEVFMPPKYKYKGKTYTNQYFIRGISIISQEAEDY